VEFLMWEVAGGSYAEVFAARGAKTSFDSSFLLLSPRSLLPRPTMTIRRTSPSQVQITWTPTGSCDRLQSASNIVGPWADIPGAVSGQFITLAPGMRFFRIVE
jgi:hypothetical protein